MKKVSVMLVLFLLSLNALADDIQTIKRQFVDALVNESEEWAKANGSLQQEEYVDDEIVFQLYKRYPVSKQQIELWLTTQSENGSWSDLDYDPLISAKSGMGLVKHLDRIYTLARLYNKVGQPWHDSQEVARTISRAMDWWFTNRPVVMEMTKRRGPKVNWWFNEIGIPKSIGASFLMFESQMTAEQKRQAVDVMMASQIGTTGQNKIWLAGNVLMRGLLRGNMDTVRMARDTIVANIVYGPVGERSEGIMKDWSFQQHGPQQQFGNYGAAFMADMGLWCSAWRNTSIAMPQEKLDIIAGLVGEGFGRAYWKGRLDVNGIGRQFFRQTQRHKGLSLWLAMEELAKADSKNKSIYERQIAGNQMGKASTKQGLYYFWNSDQTVMRQPQWMVSQRMSSNRTYGGEAGNGDNKKGYYMSDGSMYTYVDGTEYEDIFPLWDWRKLPGVTAYDSTEPLRLLSFVGYRSTSDYVGHIGDGRIGMTVMNLVRDGIKAYKSWVFTSQYVLSFGNIVEATKDEPVTTAIDQPWKREGLTIWNGKKWTVIDSLTLSQPREVRLHQNRVGYIVLSANELTATAKERTGRWSDVMGIYPESVTDRGEVVTIWLNHGVHPQAGSYAFITLPNASKQDVATFKANDIRILMNTPDMQAVYLVKEKTVFASMPKGGTLALPNGKTLSAETPGLYMVQLGKQTKVTYNDPTQKSNSSVYEIK